MFIDTPPNRNSRPAVLVRESYRENGKVKCAPWPTSPTCLMNASSCCTGFSAARVLEMTACKTYGHVAVALGTIRNLGLNSIIARQCSQQRDLAPTAARLLEPSSKLSAARGLKRQEFQNQVYIDVGDEQHNFITIINRLCWLCYPTITQLNALKTGGLSVTNT